jgi:hypothetical protein
MLGGALEAFLLSLATGGNRARQSRVVNLENQDEELGGTMERRSSKREKGRDEGDRERKKGKILRERRDWTWLYAALTSVAGLLAISLALHFEEPTNQQHSTMFWKVAEHLGMAALSVGSIGLILELRGLEGYFQKRIAKAITQKDYLRTLHKDELASLQVNTLMAFFDLDDLDAEDSLLRHCHDHIHNFIRDPYREDAKAAYDLKYSPNERSMIIDEIISFTCRMVAGSIQEEVRWFTEKGEIGRLLEFSITLVAPGEPGRFKDTHPNLSKKMTFDKDDPKNPPRAGGGNISDASLGLKAVNGTGRLGYKLSLSQYKEVDKLFVELHVRYQAPIGRSITWQMSHPSKGVSATVTYEPQWLDFYWEAFGMSHDEVTAGGGPGHHTLSYSSWLLPHTGFAFHFLEKKGQLSQDTVHEGANPHSKSSGIAKRMVD